MKRSLGFTLIEMAIVLVIIGLVAGAAIRIIKPLKDVNKTDVTLQHIATIDKALQLFVVQNGCLPCPTDGSINSETASSDAGYALASDGATHITGCSGAAVTCFAGLGKTVVPWIALGLSEDIASDGWGDRIRYYMGGSACDGSGHGLQVANAMIRCATSGAAAFPSGGLSVKDNDAGTTTTNVAYVLISSGSDRSMARIAYSSTLTANTYSQASGDAQYTNATDGTTTFVNGLVNDTNGTSHFDDIVLFKTAPLLVMLCGSNACGNPA